MVKLLSVKLAPEAVDTVKGLAGYNGVSISSLTEAMITVCRMNESLIKQCAAEAKRIEVERKSSRKKPQSHKAKGL